MNLFSISQLQQFSGIKAHTIRVWEQRYHGLNPTRSEGNTRYYNNHQLRRLLNIVSLLESDYKVSELCSMTDQMLYKLLAHKLNEHKASEGINEYYVAQLIAASTSFDEAHFEKIFSNSLLRLGMKGTYITVIYPLLVRMGLLWSSNSLSPAYEHFCCNLIRQKLNTSIDALPPPISKEKWLLFLPENEFHEIGLLFSHYIIRHSGKKVIYLGNNVPLDSLSTTALETKPDHLFFFLVHYDHPENVQDYLGSLRKYFRKTNIHFSGNEKLISQLKLGKDFNWIRSVQELENLL